MTDAEALEAAIENALNADRNERLMYVERALDALPQDHPAAAEIEDKLHNAARSDMWDQDRQYHEYLNMAKAIIDDSDDTAS